jgi:glycosyltransferase involved in cell wall biosynthesis
VIGVVIATYNGVAILDATISSVVAQTHQDFTCIIVDDGSTDGTPELARRLGDDRFRVIEQCHSGVSSARNCGLSQLPPDVDYVTFLDQDDVWETDALAQLLAAATSTDGIVGAHGLARFIDENGEPIGDFESRGRARWEVRPGKERHLLPRSHPTTFASQLLQCTVYPAGLLLARRDVYDKLSGFDPTIQFAEDWDMLLRLLRHGDCLFVDRTIIGYRRLHSALTRSPIGMGAQCHQIRVKAFWSADNSPEQSLLVRDAWLILQRGYAHDHLQSARAHIKSGDVVHGGDRLARAGLASLRYLRGHPPRPRPAISVSP